MGWRVLLSCFAFGLALLAAPGEVAQSYARAVEQGRYGQLESLLVWQGNRLVLERYWRGSGPEQLHPCYSVTKSITCLLALIAMGEGRLPGPETPLVRLLPQHAEVLSGPKSALTLGHVLGMSAGFQWDELSMGYRDPRNPVNELLRSPDPVRLLLGKPLAQAPGAAFTYNSALSNLLGRLVERATGEPIDRYAERVLFRPLGIRDYRWERLGPELNCGWGLWMKPRDLLALGRLVLARGRWQGRPVLDPALLAEALKPRLRVRPEVDYGWQFWIKHYPDSGGKGPPYPLAIGWGGQFIVILPELDAVIVSTAGDYGAEREGLMAFLDDLVRDLARD